MWHFVVLVAKKKATTCSAKQLETRVGGKRVLRQSFLTCNKRIEQQIWTEHKTRKLNSSTKIPYVFAEEV
jgi:hypothetical protein